MRFAQYIDHTLLNPKASPEEIKQLCAEAINYDFFAVCVNGCYVSLARKELQNSSVKIAAVVGFPLGGSSSESKVFEAKTYIEQGADEIDMVLNIGFLKAKMLDEVGNEIRAVKDAVEKNILKVILETCYLTDKEIIAACYLAKEAGADFVKTSTGFGSAGANKRVLQLMFNEVGGALKVKASGGIKDVATAKEYIEMGVSRIGTSSGIRIIEESK